MSSAVAAAPARLALAAATLAFLAAVVLASQAGGVERSWRTYLAPSGVCAGADDAAASRPAQRRAIKCLVNWARARDRQARLMSSRGLQRAASLKGYDVAACGQLTHTPCRSGVTDAVRKAGYRYSTFGENLFAGVDRGVSPRDVVRAWLRSPPHRANLLRPGFRQLGVAGVRTRGIVGDRGAIVWVATFGTQR